MNRCLRTVFTGNNFVLPAFLVLACSFVACGAAAAQTERPSKASAKVVQHYDPARDPANDLRLVVADARRSGKRILIDVGGEWCIWCRRLDTFFLRNDDAAQLLYGNFILLKVNVSKENQNEKFLASFPAVAGYPHLFVLDSDGTLLRSQDTGALESGKYHDHDKVIAFLERWRPPTLKE